MEVSIDAENFFSRFQRLIQDWEANKSTLWGDCDTICIPYGSGSDDLIYSKSSSFHTYLFGYEFPDTIILISRNDLYFMSNAKKCAIVKSALEGKSTSVNFHFLNKTKDEGNNRENMNVLVNAIRKNGKTKVGSLFKGEYPGTFIRSWLEMIQQNNLTKVEIASPLSLFFSVKDSAEIELCKRAAILTNKVMKHGFISEMETILDKDAEIKHTDVAVKIESIISDPTKINLKISADVVESCYNPIIQSGGKYDIKVSATSNDNILSSDVIICSLGARYKNYCANISRTFMVDAPPKVEKTYGLLLSLYNKCLEAMTPGKELKDVNDAARGFLAKADASLIAYLPKTFGFALGIEFRDGNLVLNASSTAKFAKDMVFNLSVGLQNVPLTEQDKVGTKSASIKSLNVFSLLIGDTVQIQGEGVPDILTKTSREYSDVSYSKDGDEDQGNADGNDAVYMETDGGAARRSGRLKDLPQMVVTANERTQKQREIMEKKIREGKLRLRRGENVEAEKVGPSMQAKDLQVYGSPKDYPREIVPTQVRVDMMKEVVFIPVNGYAVPFHISTIKSVVFSDEGANVSHMRISFHTPGAALAKDVDKNMGLLIEQYGGKVPFIKQISLRTLHANRFTGINTQIQELRKRVREREKKIEQEKDLVVQGKLIKIKDQRIPRLQDVNIRPQLSGKKCVGTLEAHQNGLRFSSVKGESLDILYVNIKHAIYQPCDEKTAIVLLHFHLTDFIIINKKKQKDVQFYTEIVDSSLNLDIARRYSHDHDELEEEQREREMRRRLNVAFKEFSIKLEKIAAHYDFNITIDSPYRKFNFFGNPNRDLVVISPTTNCLVNLTEMPSFLITLSEVEHVHFERVNFGGKNFDISFIFKNWDLKPRTIYLVETKNKEMIQDWLNLIEISYTVGPKPIIWTEIMPAVKDSKAWFYDEVDNEGEKKSPGWSFLSVENIMGGDEEMEEEDEESEYEAESQGSDDEDSEDSDDDDDESFDEDESDDDGEDEDEDEEEEDDEEVEREARARDRVKRPAESSSSSSSHKKSRH